MTVSARQRCVRNVIMERRITVNYRFEGKQTARQRLNVTVTDISIFDQCGRADDHFLVITLYVWTRHSANPRTFYYSRCVNCKNQWREVRPETCIIYRGIKTLTPLRSHFQELDEVTYSP